MNKLFYDLLKGQKINLQLFAEDVEDSDDNDNKDTSENKEKKEPEKKYSDEDLDRIISKKFAKWKQDQEKAVDEAKKLADMNAQEKAEYERDKIRKELEELKNEKVLNEMSKTARKMLSDEGINISDDLLANLVTTDAEKTKSVVNDFAKMFKNEVESAVKEALKGNPPKKGVKNTAITKEQIMAIKNTAERQKMINEHMELFQGGN